MRDEVDAQGRHAARLRLGARRERLRLRAGGPRIVSPRHHPHRRDSQAGEPDHVLPGGGHPHRQDPHRVHRPRQVRGDPGGCRRRRRAHRDGAGDCGDTGRHQRTAAGIALPVHRGDEGGVHRDRDAGGPLVERQPDLPWRVPAADANRRRPSAATRSSTRSAPRWIVSPPTSPAPSSPPSSRPSSRCHRSRPPRSARS